MDLVRRRRDDLGRPVMMEIRSDGRSGFVSAAVHRSSDGTRVVNYLHWETGEDLAAMRRSPEFAAIACRFDGLIEFDPHRCEVAHLRTAAGTHPE